MGVSAFVAGTLLATATMSTKSTEVTVYNQGIGFVKENRLVQVKKGRQSVTVDGVAQLIDTTSVGFRSISSPGALSILEQNYRYDLVSPQAILAKSVGKRVKVTRAFGNSKETIEGILMSSPTSVVDGPNGLSNQYNGMVVKADDGSIILSPIGEVSVLEMPTGLISTPSLLWDLQSEKDGQEEIELSYITQGMKWDANYVFTLDPAGKGDLQGWVTIDNNSGANFENAKLKLLAGEVNLVRPAQPEIMMMKNRVGAPGAAMADGFQEESLFEYHLYALGRPATVLNKERKQLSLLSGSDVPFRKRIIVDAMMGFNGYYPSEGEVGTGSQSPLVKVEFVNDKKSGLGMPLPQGKIRIYQRDKSGSVQMLGEDSIRHTPRDEKISLNVGRSFDIVSERKRTNFKRISNRSFEETFQVQVRNRKEEASTVHVYERHWGDWKITKKNMDFTKEDSNTAVFEVALKANEVKTVEYTVVTSW
jgi:hypothetical protein